MRIAKILLIVPNPHFAYDRGNFTTITIKLISTDCCKELRAARIHLAYIVTWTVRACEGDLNGRSTKGGKMFVEIATSSTKFYPYFSFRTRKLS